MKQVISYYRMNCKFYDRHTIGIMGAMPEEINGIIDLLAGKEEFQ